ncbi:hypothetical protein JCM21900_001398 [Sporobolomyces salmonicolor]
MYRDHGYNTAPTYADEIRAFRDPRTMIPGNRIVQFPFVAFQVEEEIQCELEKRQAATRRLQEQAAKQRTEKMGCQQEELVAIGELKAPWSTLKKADFDTRFNDAGFSLPEDLDDDLRKTEKSLVRARDKELGTEESEGKEAPSFSLIDVPDHVLDEDDLREKRRQKRMKDGYDAHIRLKAGKEEARRQVEERERRDRELRESDLGKGLDGLRRGHGKPQEDITALAAHGKGGKKCKRVEREDGVGLPDADWAVYSAVEK